MEVWQANLKLNELIRQVSDTVKEIVVIHGYHHGTELMKFVRYEFKDKRIKAKYVGLNNGRTSLILKARDEK